MSSNHHIISMLTRDNYEEAFLLYVDDELTAEQRAAVEAFAALHPDLKEELDLLCSTKLPAAAFSFENKSELFADSMKVAAMEESLLLYMDNELHAEETKTVAAQLKSDATFAAQYAQLLKTRLEPETIVYPYKKELYHRTERRILPYWLRVAAAVVAVAGSVAVWMNQNGSHTTTSVVVVVTPKNNTSQKTSGSEQPQTPVSTNDSKQAGAQPTPEQKSVASSNKVEKAAQKGSTKTFSNPHTALDNTIAHTKPQAPETTTEPDVAMTVPENQVAVNKLAVTSEKPLTYIPEEDATPKTPVPAFAVASSNERQSGGLKGLLRKATRVIERRTGIKTVNDDNELLVGAVALKL